VQIAIDQAQAQRVKRNPIGKINQQNKTDRTTSLNCCECKTISDYTADKDK